MKKELAYGAAAIGLFAFAVLIVLAVVNQYGYTLRTTTTTSIDDLTFNDVGIRTNVGSSGTYPYLQALSSCVNSSGAGALTTGLYTVNEGDVNGGYVVLSAAGAGYNNTAVNCSTLTYLADSTGSTTASRFVSAMLIFGSFAAVLVLALVGRKIIDMYKQG